MKYIKIPKVVFVISTVIGLFILSSCMAKLKKSPSPKNVEMIERSIQNLDLGKKFSAGEKVAIINLEYGQPMDFPVASLVEDQLVEKLHNLGAKVLERDRDILANLIMESDLKYQFVSTAMRDSVLMLKTNLLSADKILAYRILECGVRFNFGKRSENVEREAETILHVRIENPKTGLVEWTGNVKGTAKDFVQVSEVASLRDEGLIFYRHGFPTQR